MMGLAGKRIMIDASAASIGGGFTYLVNIVPHLCDLAPDTRFRLMVGTERLQAAMPTCENLEVINLQIESAAQRMRQTFFGFPKAAAEWRADLFFSVSEMAPRRMRCPSIVSFRNAAVFDASVPAANFREALRGNLLFAIARWSAGRSSRVLFVTHESAGWIGDQIGLPVEKRAVIHHGINTALWSETPPHTGHPRPYILSVGSIYHYKNFVRLIDAYVEMAKDHPDSPDLIIIGDEYDLDYRAQMENARKAAGEIGERIHILGAVPHDDVRTYYRGASLFAFPSYLETFGHPLLEAMAAGIPLVASDIPTSREVSEDAALYADPHDTHAIARALAEALRPELREELIARGRERVMGFTWDATGRRLLDLFEQVIA